MSEEELERHLRQASRHIDSLTYNRIVGRGFSNLTEFQKEVIQEVICQQADFEYENADEIGTIYPVTALMVRRFSLGAPGMYLQIKAWP
uniref:hypothetical protein n=1 Tax=Clostridium sp. NkU-1 TaxID=1095009 RepID=UPI000AC19440